MTFIPVPVTGQPMHCSANQTVDRLCHCAVTMGIMTRRITGRFPPSPAVSQECLPCRLPQSGPKLSVEAELDSSSPGLSLPCFGLALAPPKFQ